MNTINLSLLQNDPSSTLLVAENGPHYKIETLKESSTETTTILRVDGEISFGNIETVVGKVDHYPTRDMRLQLCATNLELVLHRLDEQDMDNSWSFRGPDNLPYKWQILIQAPVLTLNDNSNTLLARYRRAKLGIVSRSRRAFLEISPAGSRVIDLIVLLLEIFSHNYNIYTNESGQVVFKVETPKSLGTRTSTISRVVPNDDPEDMRDTFEIVARVDHKLVKSSVLRFGGDEIKAKAFFRKGGFGPYGRDRLFTAPNGQECKWRLGALTSKLIAKDEAKTLIAQYHRPGLGVTSKGSLEICPGGEDMVQTLVMTFIYVEKLRKDRERSSRH